MTTVRKILITGGTGLVGKALASRLHQAGHQISILSRNSIAAAKLLGPQYRYVNWNSEQPLSQINSTDEKLLQEAQVLVHLAGENIAARRWNEEVKERIRRSRVRSTQLLLQYFNQTKGSALEQVIAASAIGYYGDRGDEILQEDSTAGDGFLPSVCQEWESAALAGAAHRPLVIARFGIVLDSLQGALAKMLGPYRLGLGGPLGSGQQWMSWIHIQDLVEMLHSAISQRQARGIYNAVSPNPVINSEFNRILATVLHRPAFFKVPRLALELVLGEMVVLLLSSQRVIPARYQSEGFQFRYARLNEALIDLLRQA